MLLSEFYERVGFVDDGPMEIGRQIKLILPEDPEVPGRHEPFPHQITGLRDLLSHRLRCNFDDPGTGKTLIAMTWSLYHKGLGNRVIALMPPVLLKQFKEALETQLVGADKVCSWHILSEPPAGRWKLYQKWNAEGWPDILMMSYQKYVSMFAPGVNYNIGVEQEKLAVQKRVAAEPAAIKKTEARIRRMKIQACDHEMVWAANYTAMVCDEAKAIKGVTSNSTSNTYRAVRDFSLEPSHALALLDGTPLHNTLADAYGYMSIVDPTLYRNHNAFKYWHLIFDYNDEGREILIGFKNRDLLQKNFGSIGRRVLKKQVFPNMKDPHVQRIKVDLSSAHRSLYNKITRERFAEMPSGDRLEIDNQQHLRQVCAQITVNPSAFHNKTMTSTVIERCDELLSELGVVPETATGEKVILFAHFRSTVRYLMERYKDFNPAAIYGGNPTRSEEARLKFLNDPTCKVLVANPKSGGVGLNFQKVCRYVVFVEPTSVPGDFKQASERVHRSGQKLLVSIYLLEARGTASVGAINNMLTKEGDAIHIYQDDNSLLDSLLHGEPEAQAKAA